MNNANSNPGMQKRMLIMTLIVFVFFIAYEFLVLKPQQEEKLAEQKKIEQQAASQNAAPATEQSGSAPMAQPTTTDMSNSIDALTSRAIAPKDVLATVKTNKSIYTFDQFGRIAQVELQEEKYHDEDGKQINMLVANQLRPLEVRLANANLNDEAFKVAYTTSATAVDATQAKQTITLTQKLSATTVTKTITFYPAGNYDINVTTTNKENFFITNGIQADISSSAMGEMVVNGTISAMADGTINTIENGDAEKTVNYVGAQFVSNFDKYYATMLFNIEKPLAVTIMPDKEENPQAFIHGNTSITMGGYVGPKEYVFLNSLNPALTQAIEYGWFTFIAKPVFTFLQWIQSYVGNWGWAIVILTILIKLVLYPLSYKGMVSMNKLKELAPKIKEIQAKHKDDKQKQSAQMMELYKKHGANPMGGCLPLLLQIPVFFAIYRVLLNSIELKGAEWILWIEDLAIMDPYFVLPILMGASMFLQQKITPNTMQDEMQKKIFQMLPIVFTFFFLWFPAGLTLYWFVNNVFTIAQQYYINQLFEKKRVAKK